MLKVLVMCAQSIFLSSANVWLLIDGPQQWLFCVFIKLDSYLLINISALWEIIISFMVEKQRRVSFKQGFLLLQRKCFLTRQIRVSCVPKQPLSVSQLWLIAQYTMSLICEGLYMFTFAMHILSQKVGLGQCALLWLWHQQLLLFSVSHHCGAECINNSLISTATVSLKWMSKHVSILVPTPLLIGPVSGKERCSWTDCVSVERFSVYTTAAFITLNHS